MIERRQDIEAMMSTISRQRLLDFSGFLISVILSWSVVSFPGQSGDRPYGKIPGRGDAKPSARNGEVVNLTFISPVAT